MRQRRDSVGQWSLRFVLAIALPSTVLAQEAEPDPTGPAAIMLSNGDKTRVKVGPQHVEEGATRYPERIYLGDTAVMVEFGSDASAAPVRGRGLPPRLSDLIGNRTAQAALDRAAKPGSWVTPPAARR